MKVAFVLFSYELDSEAVVLVARRLLGSRSTASVTVVGDAARPCTPASVKELGDLGVHYYNSTWPRKGNLNGAECVAGITDSLAMAAEAAPEADWVCKMDCDTLLANNYVAALEALNPRYVGYGLTYKGCHVRGYPSWFGACYSFRAAIAREVHSRAVELLKDDENEVLATMAPRYPEDETIARVVGTFGFIHRRESVCGPRGTLFVGFPYSTGKFYDTTNRTAEAVNFGWFEGYPNVAPLNAVDRKKRMVEEMTKWDSQFPLA